MITLFEVMRGIFFFLSFLSGIIVLRGNLLFGEEIASLLTIIIVPGYLVLCGIMISYLGLQFWKTGHRGTEIASSLLIKVFVGGLFLGSLLAAVYVLI